MGYAKGSQEAKDHALKMRNARVQKLNVQKKEAKTRENNQKKSAPPMDRIGRFGGELFEFGGAHTPTYDRRGKFGKDRFGRQEKGYA